MKQLIGRLKRKTFSFRCPNYSCDVMALPELPLKNRMSSFRVGSAIRDYMEVISQQFTIIISFCTSSFPRNFLSLTRWICRKSWANRFMSSIVVILYRAAHNSAVFYECSKIRIAMWAARRLATSPSRKRSEKCLLALVFAFVVLYFPFRQNDDA